MYEYGDSRSSAESTSDTIRPTATRRARISRQEAGDRDRAWKSCRTPVHGGRPQGGSARQRRVRGGCQRFQGQKVYSRRRRLKHSGTPRRGRQTVHLPERGRRATRSSWNRAIVAAESGTDFRVLCGRAAAEGASIYAEEAKRADGCRMTSVKNIVPMPLSVNEAMVCAKTPEFHQSRACARR